MGKIGNDHFSGFSWKSVDVSSSLGFKFKLGRGRDAVGRAVTSDTRDPWFESQYRCTESKIKKGGERTVLL